MPETQSRFVLYCQQALACAVVAAVGVSAIGVVELEIIGPEPAAPASAAGSTPMSLVSTAPVKPTVRTVPLAGTSAGRSSLRGNSGTERRSPQEIRVVSEPQPVTGYATVGVTWVDGQGLTEDDVLVEVRTLVDGVWSPWQEMHFDPSHQADPIEAGEDSDIRGGTDAVVVGDVDDVQVRAVSSDGPAPEGLALAIVDPGEEVAPVEEAPAIDTGTASTTASAPTSGDAAVLAANGMPTAPKPKIFSRAQWGADERLRDPGSLRYGEIRAGFVHHTVNANGYTREQVPSILRGIYAYHTRSRGWSDVGYNFLVDRFGQIWEGRYGGVDRPVIGAHTLGYNEEAFAMSAIGNFDVAAPSAAMVKAYGQLFAWKLSLHGIAADDGKQWVDDRYFPAINGHRDAGSTACPGQHLYAKLAEIRRLATAFQKGSGTSEPPAPPEPPEPTEPPPPTGPGAPLDANLSGTDWPDLVVRDARTKRALIVRTHGQYAFEKGVTAAKGWSGRDLVVAAGDVDGDGLGDVVAREADGTATLFPGAGDGTVRAAALTYDRFSRVDQLTGVGDFDGDGDADLVGRRADTGRLLLFRGRGDGRFGRAALLSTDWTRYDLTTGVNDFDGDGRVDLVARSGETLYLVPGSRSAGVPALGQPVALPGRWDGFDVLSGRGDVTADGRPDLLARVTEGGSTYVYPGDGAGGVGPRLGGWERYADVAVLAVGGQLAGSRKPDLLAVSANRETLRVFANTGRRNVGEPIDTGVVLDDINLLLNVGDWNGDGRGDVMTRSASTGALQLRAGLRRNRLGAPVTVAAGWGAVSRVAAVGDVTGDGNPDLVARADGADRIYPGDGAHGMKQSYVARSKVAGRSEVGVGMWDSDTTPDTALRRTDGSLWLWRTHDADTVQVADGLRRYDWVRGLGDLDGDDRADLVVRARKDGRLYLLPGRASGFGPRRLIAPGFGGYDYAG